MCKKWHIQMEDMGRKIDLGMYADIDDAAKVVEEYKQQCRLVGDII